MTKSYSGHTANKTRVIVVDERPRPFCEGSHTVNGPDNSASIWTLAIEMIKDIPVSSR